MVFLPLRLMWCVALVAQLVEPSLECSALLCVCVCVCVCMFVNDSAQPAELPQ